MNVSTMNKDKYISIQELADLKGVSTRAIRMSRDKYVTREISVRGGKSFEILLSSIELDLQKKYFEAMQDYIDYRVSISKEYKNIGLSTM